MKGKQLFHGVEIKEWAIVSFAHPRKCSEDHLRSFTQKLARTGNDSGMPFSPQPCFIRYARNDKEVWTQQGCSPKILTRGALCKWSWALPKRKCLIFGSLKTVQFPASYGFII